MLNSTVESWLDEIASELQVKNLGVRFPEDVFTAQDKPSTDCECWRPVELFVDPRIGRRRVTKSEDAT